MVVPTGVGASIGGYAGDALPAARLLAAVSGRLITHPNVLNGAMLYWPIDNAWYVEGYALDRFCAGDWALQPIPRGTRNRVGVVFDGGIEADLLQRHLQVCDAVRATLGISVTGYTVTRQPVGVHLGTADSGASTGSVTHPEALLEAAAALRRPPHACDALALVCRFPGDEEDPQKLAAYRQGQGVDSVGGAEALLSHWVTRELQVPCAHAPALDPLGVDASISPKAAAEELGYTFLPSVLVGLSRAPRLCSASAPHRRADAIGSDAVDAVVAPYDACGGETVQALYRQGKLVIAVRENTTCLSQTPEWLEAQDGTRSGTLRVARSYAEAAGLIAAHRAGIFLPALTATVERIPRIPIAQEHLSPPAR